MMNLFKEYKKLREKYEMPAKDAYRSASHKAATLWKKELRGWDFDVRAIVANMNENQKRVWLHTLPSGHLLMVKASYDYDVDELDGLCKVEYHKYREYQDQECGSHEDGTYWISTNDGYALVEMEDGGIETGWYRKKGMAKQPAIERAIEARKKMVNWIEDYVQGNVIYGCFEVRILRPDEYEDHGEDATPVSYAGPLCGVDCDDEEYLLDMLNELFDEATHGLTL